MVVHGIDRGPQERGDKEFIEQMNRVFADPTIEVVKTTYCFSWPNYAAFIEYETK
jgi:hypothetical protein